MRKGIIFVMLGMIVGMLGQMAGKKVFNVKIFYSGWWNEEKSMQHWG